MTKLVLLLGLLAVPMLLQAAEPPPTVNHQGLLLDAGGQPVNGFADFRFRFYDVPAAGAAILEDQHDGVQVVDGVWNTSLGAGVVSDGPGTGSYVALPDVFRDFTDVFLEIQVGAEILTPRVKLESTPFALNADLIDGRDASEFLDTTSNPQQKLGRLSLTSGVGTGESGLLVGTSTTIPSPLPGGPSQAGTFSIVDQGVDGGSATVQLALLESELCGESEWCGRAIGLSSDASHLAGRFENTSTGTAASLGTFYAGVYGFSPLGGYAGDFNGFVRAANNAETLRLQGADRTFLSFFLPSAPILNDFTQRGRLGFLSAGSPIMTLQNDAGGALALNAAGGGGNIHLNAGGVLGAFVQSGSGYVGVRTTAPLRTLTVNGTTRTTNSDGFWTTAGWGRALELPIGYAVQWLGSSPTYPSRGIGYTSDGKLYLIRSTANDGTAAATYDVTVDPSGRVGIGTTSPTTRLEVNSGDIQVDGMTLNGDTATAAQYVTSAELVFSVDSDDNSTNQFFYWMRDGQDLSAATLMRLNGGGATDGNLYLGGTLFSNQFDLAEAYLEAEPVEPGDLVSVVPGSPDTVTRSRGASDRAVIGVVSTQPSLLMGGSPLTVDILRRTWGPQVAERFASRRERLEAELTEAGGEFHARVTEIDRTSDRAERGKRRSDFTRSIESHVLQRFAEQEFAAVALAGRVPVKVDAALGPIAVGDALAPGPTPGVAMRANGPGPTVGIALEAIAAGRGSIMMLVSRGWYPGDPASPADVAAEPGVTPQTASAEPGATAADSGASGLSAPATAGSVRSSRSATEPGVPSADLAAADPSLVGATGEGEAASAAVGATQMWVDVTGLTEVGDVLAIDAAAPGRFRAADREADVGVVGIVVAVTAPSGAADDPAPGVHAALAITGIVPCKVDASYGEIRAGDLLSASPTRGHAMRAVNGAPGTVIGKALEPLQEGTGVISTLAMSR